MIGCNSGAAAAVTGFCVDWDVKVNSVMFFLKIK